MFADNTVKFPVLEGNERVAATVCDAIKNRKLPHAVIVEGSSEQARKSVALFLAKGAVCIEEDAPCMNCRNCYLVESGSHPDVSVTTCEDNKKSIAVGAVRELRNDAYLKPNMAEKRVFIIDPAEAMNEAAQNALLKVLEEPPQSAMFILLAKSSANLLETVRSRCIAISLADSLDEVADKINNMAGQFLTYVSQRNAYECLLLLNGLDKDRRTTDMFFDCLKGQTAKMLTKNLSGEATVLSSGRLNGIYSLCDEAIASLSLNINLQLLFTKFCSGVFAL